MTMSGDIGQRIATYRRRRGMSQVALAGLIGLSESWLSQVERGMCGVDRMSVVLDLARVLGVRPDDLIGRPWRFAPNGGPVTEGLTDLRRVFTRYDALLGDVPPATLDLPEIWRQVEQSHRTYQAADYEQVMATLPELLLQTDVLLAGGEAGRAAQCAAGVRVRLRGGRQVGHQARDRGPGHARRRSRCS